MGCIPMPISFWVGRNGPFFLRSLPKAGAGQNNWQKCSSPYFPPNELGLSLVVDHWEDQSLPPAFSWQRSLPEPTAPREDHPYLISELQTYLGEAGFQWLCACAVYPELYWELCLDYRTLVAEHYDLAPASLPLLRLLGLPWMRSGRFPRSLRLDLHQRLNTALAIAVRKRLIHLLQQPQNRGPEGKRSRQQQETTLAIYQYMNSDQAEQDLEDLTTQLERVDPHSIRDVVSLQQVSSIRKNPLAIQLPKGFYKGGIPLYGTKWWTRLGMVLLPLLLFWAGYLLVPSDREKVQGEHPYPVEAFVLENAVDSARFAIYEGYWSYKNGEWEKAQTSFELAIETMFERPYDSLKLQKIRPILQNLYQNLLQERPGLGEDIAAINRSYPLAFANLAKLNFRQAKQSYDQEAFIQATTEFSSCCSDTLQLEVQYALGLSLLYTGNIPAAMDSLLALQKPWFQDTTDNSPSLFTQALPQSKTNLVQQLTKLYAAQSSSTQDQLDTLFNWLGEQSPEVERLLAEAQGLFGQWRWSEALHKYEQILLQDPENALALERRDACLQNIKDVQAHKRRLAEADSLFGLEEWAEAKEKYAFMLGYDNLDKAYIRNQITSCEANMNDGSDQIGDQGGEMESAPPQDQPSVSDPAPPPPQEEDEEETYAYSLPPFEVTEIIPVKGGTFTMGREEGKGGYEDERPQHKVLLTDFNLEEHEVTNAQYANFLQATQPSPSERDKWIGLASSSIRDSGGFYSVKEGYERHPVRYVSWYGAVAYSEWLSQQTGKKYRLPSEAEWEYAARGGRLSKGYLYAGSDDPDQVSWYRLNANTSQAVKTKDPNELGLYDMSGNVWEWCQDWYDYQYYQSCKLQGKVSNPTGPQSGSRRVLRGGSWASYASSLRVSDRSDTRPDRRHTAIGFRLARQP